MGNEKVSLSESNNETLDTLRDIEAFFRKEAAYEVENMGNGGSSIALGRWKRYYMALANIIQDLPELIAHDKELATLRAENAALAADARRYRWLRAADNDELVLRVFGPDDKKPSRPLDLSVDYCYLPRDEHLDAAIDAALARTLPTGENT